MKITAEFVREYLRYDPETGVFTWIKGRTTKSRAGTIAGSRTAAGYNQIMFFGKVYKASRLAWLIMTGTFPVLSIDHADLDKSNDRWANLREATFTQNSANTPVRKDSRTGVKGVVPQRDKWSSRIWLSGVRYYLGTYDSIQEAKAAYDEASTRFHGKFSRSA